MTPVALRELIAAGESLTVEFKGEERRQLSDRELVEGVVCLANRAGNDPAWLLVGVEDDGRVTGARPRHGAGVNDPLRIQALIANQTRPSLACRVELVELEGRPVLVIEVPPARTPVGTADGTYVRRAIGSDGRPACLPFHFHEMQALQASRGVLDYSALTVPEASWDDLDPLEFQRFRRNIRESGGQGDASLLTLPDLELAKALGAVDANHSPTLRGFEPIQQQHIVLQFARAHGRITRAQAAELCKITPSQAYRLLRKLAEEGRLMRHGTGKRAWYEPRA